MELGLDLKLRSWSWNWSWNLRSWNWSWSWNLRSWSWYSGDLPELELELELKPPELELELIFWRLAGVGVGVGVETSGVGVGVDIKELTPTLMATLFWSKRSQGGLYLNEQKWLPKRPHCIWSKRPQIVNDNIIKWPNPLGARQWSMKNVN